MASAVETETTGGGLGNENVKERERERDIYIYIYISTHICICTYVEGLLGVGEKCRICTAYSIFYSRYPLQISSSLGRTLNTRKPEPP